MRLYPTNDVPRTVIDHPAWGHFEAGGHGGFDLPDELSDEMHSFHHRGKRIWETEDERSDRLRLEGLAHRRDPAALFETVSGMADLTRQLAEAQLAQGRPALADPAEEIAALRRRIAELEGAQPHPTPADGDSDRGGTEEKPGSAAGSGAESGPKPESGAKAPAKPRPSSAKSVPAA